MKAIPEFDTDIFSHASVRNANYYELGLVHPNAPSTSAPP